MTIERTYELPEDFNSLAQEAASQGHHFLIKMQQEWQQGKNTFNRNGEACFVVRDSSGKLIAVGGLNIDPYAENPRIGRIRHIYVSKKRQRAGLGKKLLERIIEEAHGRFDALRLKTQNPEAVSFYTSLEFQTDASYDDPTHYYFIKKMTS